jgi:hypothetical protein
MHYKEQILNKIKEIFENSKFLNQIDVSNFSNLEELELEKVLFLSTYTFNLEKNFSPQEVNEVEHGLNNIALSITNIYSTVTKSFISSMELKEKD